MLRLLFASAATFALAIPAHAAEPTRFSVVTVGRGPDIILIPGLSSPRAVWLATAERLKATHRVHLIQLKGFGEPAGANASGPVLQPFVDELGAYIVDRKLKRPAVVGHSGRRQCRGDPPPGGADADHADRQCQQDDPRLHPAGLPRDPARPGIAARHDDQ